MDIIFKDNKIQTGYRIKIPKAVIDTLELKEGQEVVILFDPIKKKMVLEIKK
jgi:bifunctional DNA-binding transcriptional regulator/antitoxin component of YhaV-PrlF toxin-antitoxin module